MTPEQKEAFYAAAGFHASGMSFDVRLLVGGVALIICMLILAGLMHLLDSSSSKDKVNFILNVFGLSLILMLIFIYLA